MVEKKVRSKEIAPEAHVSKGTVDRVVTKRGRVSPKVASGILKMINDTGYKPNLTGRAPASKKATRIAVLIPKGVSDDSWRASIAGIQKAEQKLKAYHVYVGMFYFDPYLPGSFAVQASKIGEADFDGIIVSPTFYREALPFFIAWKEKNIPFVLFNTAIHDNLALCYIGQDPYQSGLLAAKLVYSGHFNQGTLMVAHFDEEISNTNHLREKERGFKDYFGGHQPERANIVKQEFYCLDNILFTAQLDQMMADHPDLKAIYVTCSRAHQIANYLQQRHICGVKIVGYDLSPENLAFLNNDMITFLINQNPQGQAYLSLQLIADWLLFKTDMPRFKHLPLDIVAKENSNDFLSSDLFLYAC